MPVIDLFFPLLRQLYLNCCLKNKFGLLLPKKGPLRLTMYLCQHLLLTSLGFYQHPVRKMHGLTSATTVSSEDTRNIIVHIIQNGNLPIPNVHNKVSSSADLLSLTRSTLLSLEIQTPPLAISDPDTHITKQL